MNRLGTGAKLATVMLLSTAPMWPSPQQLPSSQNLHSYYAAHAESIQKGEIRALWHDPMDIPSLNLAWGQGGKRHAPRQDAVYKFVKEDLEGSATKFYIEDDD